jgi:hypothetical protein
MVSKFVVVITAAPLRADRHGAPARIVLVKEMAGKSPAAADRHARAWFETAHPDYGVIALDVHTMDEYEATLAEFEGVSIR